MLYSIAYLFILLRGNIFLLLCFSLFAVLKLIEVLSASVLAPAHLIVLYFIAFSIPVSGWIASLFVEKNISSLYKKEFLSKSAFVIAVALCFQSGRSLEYIIAAVEAVNNRAAGELIALAINTTNSALKCSAIVALSLLVLTLVIEFPFIWLCNAFNLTYKADISLSALRPTACFVILIFTFDLIVSFISQKLWPAFL